MNRLAILGAVALATQATATVTGLDVDFEGTIWGRDIYSVYVLSDGPNANGMHDVLLNMIGHTVTNGTMNDVLHVDNYASGGTIPGHWNASYTSASTAPWSNRWVDSYVTITGNTGSGAGTALDPSFGTGDAAGVGGPIPSAAGWYTTNPAVDILITGGRIKIMQIALAEGSTGYTARMHVGYKLQGTMSPLYAMNLTYQVPAPGGIALLACAGAGRRRAQRRA